MEELPRDCIEPSSGSYGGLSGVPTRVSSRDADVASYAIALSVCRVGFTIQGTFRILGAEPAPGEEQDTLELWPPHVTGSVADAEAAARIMTFRHFAPNLAVQLSQAGEPPKSERFLKVGLIFVVAPDGKRVITAMATSRYRYDSEDEECEPVMHGQDGHTIILEVGP